MMNWINKKRNKKGFTLVELVVVIAILGILAALAIPRLTGSRHTANKRTIEANLRSVDSAITIREADGQGLATQISDLTSASANGSIYLQAAPVTDGVTYAITNGRATVTIAANTFGTHAAAPAGTTVEQLKALTGW